MSLLQVRELITSLNPTLQPEEFDRVKKEALFLLGGAIEGNGEPLHRRLSPREGEVMKLMLSGLRLKEIAARLNISVKTVTTHRARLLKKLSVDDNLGLYRYGIRNGLIEV